MITDELLSYIETQRERGISDDSIREALLAQGGWSGDDVAEAFEVAGAQAPAAQTAQKGVESSAQPAVSQAPPADVSTEPKQASADAAPGTPAGDQPSTSRSSQNTVAGSTGGSKGKMFALIAAVVIVIGVAAVGGVYAYTLLVGTGGGDEMRKEQIIFSAFSNLSDVSSFGYQGDFRFEGESEVQGTASFTAHAEGVSDVGGEIDNFDALHRVSADGTFNDSTGGMGMTIGVEGEIRFTDKTLYLYVERVPEIVTMFVPVPVRQWIHIPASEGQLEEFQDAVAVSKEGADDVPEEFVIDAFRLAAEHGVYVIRDGEADTINGQEMHAFEIAFFPEHLQGYADDLVVMAQERDDLPAEMKAEITKWYELEGKNISEEEIAQMQQITENMTIEIMIGKEDLLPYRYRFALEGEFPVNDLMEGSERIAPPGLIQRTSLQSEALAAISSVVTSAEAQEETVSLLFDLEIRFSDFNEPVVVEEPENAISFEEAMEKAMEQSDDMFMMDQ